MSSNRYPRQGFDLGRTWAATLAGFWYYEALASVIGGGLFTFTFTAVLAIVDRDFAFFFAPLEFVFSVIGLIIYFEYRRSLIEPDLVRYYEYILKDQGFLHRFLFDMDVSEMKSLIPHISFLGWRLNLDSPPRTMKRKLARLAGNWHAVCEEAGISPTPPNQPGVGAPVAWRYVYGFWLGLVFWPAMLENLLVIRFYPWTLLSIVVLWTQFIAVTGWFYRKMMAKAVLAAIINIRYISEDGASDS